MSLKVWKLKVVELKVESCEVESWGIVKLIDYGDT